MILTQDPHPPHYAHMRTKAYSYLRFSTPEQQRGDSFRRQRELALRYAAAHDLDLDEGSYRDLGISAFRGTNARSGALGAFLRAVDDGLIPTGSVLLVESLDRVSRQDPWDALPLFQQIINAGVTIVTLQDGKTYSKDDLKANPIRIIESILLMMNANEESAKKSRRIKASWEAKRSRASKEVVTARTPAWLSVSDEKPRKFVVIAERASVVCRIFDMALSGLGQHAIAARLNAEGVPTFGSAKVWHRSYVKKILGNAAVIGDFTPHVIDHSSGKRMRRPLETIRDYYPAIVDEGIFARTQALYAGKNTPHARGELRSLLGGIVHCPHCGWTMTRVSKGPRGGKPRLVCTKAKGGRSQCPSVIQEVVEAAVIGNIRRLLSSVPTVAGNLSDDLRSVEANIADLHARIERITRAIEHGDYRPEPGAIVGPKAIRVEVRLQQRSPRLPQLVLKLRTLEDDLDKAEARKAELEGRLVTARGPNLGRRLKELATVLGTTPLDYGPANSLLRQLFSVVSFDKEFAQIVFTWRHGGESCIPLGAPENYWASQASEKVA